MSFLVPPSCPLYFPDVDGIKYGDQPQKGSWFQQFWKCDDVIKFQIYWPNGVPGSIFADLVDIAGSTFVFSPVSFSNNVALFEVDISTTGLCDADVYIQIRWDDGQIRAIATANMFITDNPECIDNTIFITYSSPKDFILTNSPVIAADHTIRIRAYYQYQRTVNEFTQSKGFTGISANVAGTAANLYKFVIPQAQGHPFFHSVSSAIFQFDSIKIARPNLPTSIASPEYLEFIRESDYIANINDPIGEKIWVYPGEGILKLKADNSHINNC